MNLPDGTRLGHHQIVATLGAGGMGVVYRATDMRLGRDVALKTLLSSGGPADAGLVERLRREARAIAAVNHPNIVTIHTVEEVDGVVFLTMELVEGRALSQDLPPGGLALPEFLDIAVPLADALAAAHAQGIVHRDLKPSNVMRTADGRLKVLDFGLAKMRHDTDPADTQTQLQTQSHLVLGTLPYMSPEQVEGHELDLRSDIFSLGVLFYELICGQRPFAGASPASLTTAILRDPAVSLRQRRPEIPGPLEHIIERCLEKNRERRLQTTVDLRQELEAVRRAASVVGAPSMLGASAHADQRQSIVAVPFANLSPDSDDESFSDGLTEEITADLSKIGALRVISRTSAVRFKGARKDVRAIRRELGVHYVLDGSVRKAGTSLRITAQLIHAESDTQVWSAKYSGTLDDVFAVQEQVSREIVDALNITLTSDERRQLSARPVSDARAYELFLQARQEQRRYALDRAEALLRAAMVIEGDTPPLSSLLAMTRITAMRLGLSPDRLPLVDAGRVARSLVAQYPQEAYGHALLGLVEYENGHLPESVHHYKRAVTLAPSDSDSITGVSICYFNGGQNGDAAAWAERAMTCDPLSPFAWLTRGVAKWFIGRPAEGLPDLLRGIDLDPSNFIVRWCLAYNYLLLRQVADCRRHAEVLVSVNPDAVYTRQLMGLLEGIEGRHEAVREWLRPIEIAPLDSHQVFHVAESYIWAGDHDRGLALLERAVQGFYPSSFIATHCWLLEPVRSSPRFQKIAGAARARADTFAAREQALG